jgi:hypothetical protein
MSGPSGKIIRCYECHAPDGEYVEMQICGRCSAAFCVFCRPHLLDRQDYKNMEANLEPFSEKNAVMAEIRAFAGVPDNTDLCVACYGDIQIFHIDKVDALYMKYKMDMIP